MVIPLRFRDQVEGSTSKGCQPYPLGNKIKQSFILQPNGYYKRSLLTLQLTLLIA
jgi:hypothetical protein